MLFNLLHGYFYSSTFRHTSLSSNKSFPPVVSDSIVSHDTPATFCLGRIYWRFLALSLGFSVTRRVWSFLYSWIFPCLYVSLALSSRYVAIILALSYFSLLYYFFLVCYWCMSAETSRAVHQRLSVIMDIFTLYLVWSWFLNHLFWLLYCWGVGRVGQVLLLSRIGICSYEAI